MTNEHPAKNCAGKRPGRFKNRLLGLIPDRWPSSLAAGKILGYFLSRLSFQDVDIVVRLDNYRHCMFRKRWSCVVFADTDRSESWQPRPKLLRWKNTATENRASKSQICQTDLFFLQTRQLLRWLLAFDDCTGPTNNSVMVFCFLFLFFPLNVVSHTHPPWLAMHVHPKTNHQTSLPSPHTIWGRTLKALWWAKRTIILWGKEDERIAARVGKLLKQRVSAGKREA